ncbi:MAG: dinitrogenase iron-molybdenum cofactor biosynthesis protein [Oscillatoriaceae cyanobacterium Prado104]|jgi:nitrogen fixation protein NifX|nr:dinitrogenase iron-molybdenum cofactor biosynthesis protein [Oscillatoriaceae cyanobacterium Prado104]
MAKQPISNKVALRIALAAKLFPELPLSEFIQALQTYAGSDVIDEKSLSTITVASLKQALGISYEVDGEETGDDADASDMANMKEAVRILWGEMDEAEDLPALDPYQEGDMPNSIRVAVASNNKDKLDGHFGSCARFLVYQLSPTEMRLIDIRSALEAEFAEDKNAFRVELIRDCHVLYIAAIGGPAAGKVTQANIYPIKKETGGPAREILSQLQNAIATSPPPWLAKLLGVADGERVKNYRARTYA